MICPYCDGYGWCTYFYPVTLDFFFYGCGPTKMDCPLCWGKGRIPVVY